MSDVTEKPDLEAFGSFAREVGPRVRRALVAAFGPDVGTDAAAEAMAIAWERWPHVASRSNPAGYVWGIGRNVARKQVEGRRLFPVPEPQREPWIEPRLAGAIGELTEHQRAAVLLVHGFRWSYREVAEMMGITVSSVQSHVDRAMVKLRRELGVEK